MGFHRLVLMLERKECLILVDSTAKTFPLNLEKKAGRGGMNTGVLKTGPVGP
jgi:hypothetical protein